MAQRALMIIKTFWCFLSRRETSGDRSVILVCLMSEISLFLLDVTVETQHKIIPEEKKIFI